MGTLTDAYILNLPTHTHKGAEARPFLIIRKGGRELPPLECMNCLSPWVLGSIFRLRSCGPVGRAAVQARLLLPPLTRICVVCG